MDEEPPDLYAIGFQELDLSPEAFMLMESPREKEWTDVSRGEQSDGLYLLNISILTVSLHSGAKYLMVKSVRLVGMMMLVYIKEGLLKYITNIRVGSVGTGKTTGKLVGMVGNKGGVGVRMTFHQTDICIVNSHLPAHQLEIEKRNKDFHEICNR